jgi:hypothetical protein
MKSSIDRIKLTFLAVFLVACGAILFYHARYVWPRDRCEAHGGWWDERDTECATPMPIWTFTHRVPGEVAPATPRAALAKPVAAKPAPAKPVAAKSAAAKPKPAAKPKT